MVISNDAREPDGSAFRLMRPESGNKRLGTADVMDFLHVQVVCEGRFFHDDLVTL